MVFVFAQVMLFCLHIRVIFVSCNTIRPNLLRMVDFTFDSVPLNL